MAAAPQALLLVSGDSALGYRLPLGSLPEYKEPDDEDLPHDPFAPLPELGQEVVSAARALVEPKPAPTPAEIVRTALAVEPRDGTLHVYMPPIKLAEDYLALIAAVEAAAESLQFEVRIEGYEPPTDVRLNALRITPDPGVIEVNIHPARAGTNSSRTRRRCTRTRAQTRLGTEKFMLDGRHTGTGGGNHVDARRRRRRPTARCCAGPICCKASSRIGRTIRRCRICSAGMFIGPTSQAPRVDEARDDSLYELEIAFQQMAHRQQPAGSAAAVARRSAAFAIC